MKPPTDGWDRDERDAIDELQDELTPLQARHRSDLPIDLLSAARHDALPPDLQAAAERRLADDAWSRALVNGLDGIEPSLDAGREDQLLARIQKEAAAQPKSSSWTWRYLALGGAAAAGVIAAAFLLRPGAEMPPEVRPQPQATIANARPAPRFELPLDKPDVTLSLKALTWRGAGEGNALLADLKQPLDAFRRGDYQQADRYLSALESRYPEAVEIFFYGGLARLFLNEPKRAVASLERASTLADETFAPRIAWYRAVAEQRTGNDGEARRQLETVCRSGGERSRDACSALAQIGATATTPDAR
jgi:hypothetical protein